MQGHFSIIEGLASIGEVVEYTGQVWAGLGVIRRSYHFYPVFDEPTSARTIVYARGFSDAWLDHYRQADVRKYDPIPLRTIEHGAMLKWTDAMEMGPNTPEQERYFDAMRKEGLIHGVGLPLFGPRCRDAYSGFDFGRPVEEIPADIIESVFAVAQAGHQRVSKLISTECNQVELSEREHEVLGWIAQGKSSTDIGTILAISPDTVRTYTKRVFAKLEVHDRIGATIKGLQLGLVRS